MFHMPPSLIEILRKTEAYFRNAGVEPARQEAEWLIAHVLGCRRLDLYLRFDQPMDDAILAQLRPLVRRRAQREPLQHILGQTPFANLQLKTDRRALIPRPETEYLIELLLERHVGENMPRQILDLGTGSGAIALALAAALPSVRVWGVDCSPEALSLARENAQTNGLSERVQWVQSNWFSALDPDQCFDWIVSNPPYLTEEEWRVAEPEVRVFDPKDALVAAEEGIADLVQIIENAFSHLHPGGLLACETGISQHECLFAKAEARGYCNLDSLKDHTGRPRFFLARRPA